MIINYELFYVITTIVIFVLKGDQKELAKDFFTYYLEVFNKCYDNLAF